MATGGLVNIIPDLSDISGKQYIFGLTREIIDKLSAWGGASYPPKKYWGNTDKLIGHHVYNKPGNSIQKQQSMENEFETW
jgi:hypothetical protein